MVGITVSTNPSSQTRISAMEYAMKMLHDDAAQKASLQEIKDAAEQNQKVYDEASKLLRDLSKQQAEIRAERSALDADKESLSRAALDQASKASKANRELAPAKDEHARAVSAFQVSEAASKKNQIEDEAALKLREDRVKAREDDASGREERVARREEMVTAREGRVSDALTKMRAIMVTVGE